MKIYLSSQSLCFTFTNFWDKEIYFLPPPPSFSSSLSPSLVLGNLAKHLSQQDVNWKFILTNQFKKILKFNFPSPLFELGCEWGFIYFREFNSILNFKKKRVTCPSSNHYFTCARVIYPSQFMASPVCPRPRTPSFFLFEVWRRGFSLPSCLISRQWGQSQN